MTTLTWDPRGVGESIHAQKVKHIKADYTTWATVDFEAVICFVRKKFPTAKIVSIGHSIGGIYMFLAQSSHIIHRAVTISTVEGSVKHLEQRKMAYLLAKLVQLKLHRYLPLKIILGYEVPYGISEQWANWALTESYVASEPHFAEKLATFNSPILSIFAKDDEVAQFESIQSFHKHLGSEVEFRILCPKDFQLDQIGHNGFFTNKRQPKLLPEWQFVADYLKAS